MVLGYFPMYSKSCHHQNSIIHMKYMCIGCVRECVYVLGFLPLRPTPLDIQPPSRSRGADRDVSTTMYCISRHVNAGFASSANAQSPAANGAEADVPENCSLKT